MTEMVTWSNPNGGTVAANAPGSTPGAEARARQKERT